MTDTKFQYNEYIQIKCSTTGKSKKRTMPLMGFSDLEKIMHYLRDHIMKISVGSIDEIKICGFGPRGEHK